MMKFDWIPVTRYEQNCSVLWCDETRKAAIIDPGGDLAQIEWLLEIEHLELEVVLATHGHFDHAGAAAPLAAKTGARLEGPHEGDAHLVQGLGEYGCKKYGYTPDRFLNDGDRITFGNVHLDVLHCPGHTWGHVAYFEPQTRWAFVGDILFENAIGNWKHSDGCLPKLVHSIRYKLFPLGDDVRFLPGHGEVSNFGRERKTNPFVGDAQLDRLRKLAARARDSDSGQ